uniref:OSJNBa0060N03.2 protein n=1 Tax=Oryza sativa subsp. japonica TaxID=39947 RepID=Q7XPF9_ORYSJ|nr:OSJNBa0060N03.2 [Oryza sativa Japonica Group]
MRKSPSRTSSPIPASRQHKPSSCHFHIRTSPPINNDKTHHRQKPPAEQEAGRQRAAAALAVHTQPSRRPAAIRRGGDGSGRGRPDPARFPTNHLGKHAKDKKVTCAGRTMLQMVVHQWCTGVPINPYMARINGKRTITTFCREVHISLL